MIQQDRSHVTIRSSPEAAAEQSLRISYTIEVPNWIEVSSTVEEGKQTVIGVRIKGLCDERGAPASGSVLSESQASLEPS
jgi:hypothetical protein